MALSPTIVCNTILKRAFAENIPITPMKLQKLLYFVSCEYIKSTGISMLSEDFCVWQYGPVLPSVYYEFQSFHGNQITKYAQDAEGNSFAYNEESSPPLKQAMNCIWETFKNMDGIHLSKITHEDGSGWSEAFSRQETKISKDDMKADDSYTKYILH